MISTQIIFDEVIGQEIDCNVVKNILDDINLPFKKALIKVSKTKTPNKYTFTITPLYLSNMFGVDTHNIYIYNGKDVKKQLQVVDIPIEFSIGFEQIANYYVFTSIVNQIKSHLITSSIVNFNNSNFNNSILTINI